MGLTEVILILLLFTAILVFVVRTGAWELFLMAAGLFSLGLFIYRAASSGDISGSFFHSFNLFSFIGLGLIVYPIFMFIKKGRKGKKGKK